ncbi:MAG: restriction endonuclease subunit S, partial [Candidatus Omnitrophica bacterium]|nr:restriction endonuclease subunit S [Candidatus Omnitrophota bacterium]
MNNWQEYRFGDLVNFPPRVSLKRGDEYPFIDMEAVNPCDRFVESFQRKRYESSGCSKFANGDVLLARITPCLENGKIAQAKIGNGQVGFGSTEFFVFRSKEDLLDQNFLFYLSKCDLIWKSAVNSMVGASGRQRADAAFLKRVRVKIPKREVQKKIAAILSGCDELIANNKKRIALLEKMAQEIYREWFVRFRFPGYEKVK